MKKTIRLALVEPIVRHSVRVNKTGKIGDVGIRLSLGYLAGYIRETVRNVDTKIFPYRLYELEGLARDLIKDLKDFDMVGITATTTEFPDAERISEAAKKLGKIVVLGGMFATANPEYVLSSPNIDVVVRGEGEETLRELIEVYGSGNLSSVKGISYKKDGVIVHNSDRELTQNINMFKPAWDLMELERYAATINWATIYASRGCLMNCSFCTISPHWRRSYRKRDIERIVQELALLKEKGFGEIRIDDDSIFLDASYGESVFKTISETDMKLKFRVKARVDDINEERLDLMSDAGVSILHFGVESPIQRILDKMRKGYDGRDLGERLRLIAQSGMIMNPSFILGIPGEDTDSLLATADYIKSVHDMQKCALIYTSLITAHPGSTLRVNARERGLRIINNDLDDYAHWMLTAIPDSLGDRFYAVSLLYETQKDVVSYVNGLEPHLTVQKVLEKNPELNHLDDYLV
jgi:radical SAM superfamily enzyme YgiQ (UPF0313 family)